MRRVILLAVAIVLSACAHPRPDLAVPDDRASCLRETGSRIAPAPGDCNGNPGRVVTREEMERSGAFNTSEALRRSVPQAR